MPEEKCRLCGRLLAEGDGRFRLRDNVECLPCHDARIRADVEKFKFPDEQ